MVGNHEYRVPGAAGYFDYFNGVGLNTARPGAATGAITASTSVAWHLVALNSHCRTRRVNPYADGCAAGSPQEQWLRTDLAAHPAPARSRTSHRCSAPACALQQPCAAALPARHAGGAEVLLTGTSTTTTIGADGAGANRDGARGVRQFVVGPGRQERATATGSRSPTAKIREQPHLRRAQADAPACRLPVGVRPRDRRDVHGRRRERVPLIDGRLRRPRQQQPHLPPAVPRARRRRRPGERVLDAGAGRAPYRACSPTPRYETADFIAVKGKKYRSPTTSATSRDPGRGRPVRPRALTQVLEHLPEPATVLAELQRVLGRAARSGSPRRCSTRSTSGPTTSSATRSSACAICWRPPASRSPRSTGWRATSAR